MNDGLRERKPGCLARWQDNPRVQLTLQNLPRNQAKLELHLKCHPPPFILYCLRPSPLSLEAFLNNCLLYTDLYIRVCFRESHLSYYAGWP